MANDLNMCCFVGRLGKEPEVRFLPSGDQVASFSLAVGSQWKDKSGEKQESTEWVNCVIFGKLAGVAGEYLQKGSQVHIVGRMKTDKYQAKDGSDRYSTKIVVDRMQMLGGKPKAENGQADSGGYNERPAQNSGSKQGGDFDDMEDDIPF